MDVVALLVIVALPLLGILSVQEALAGFSDPNVVLIAALFVIGEGLVRTGIAYRIGEWMAERAGNSETRLIVLLMVSVAGLGSVMSSTGVVAIFIPVVLSIAARMKVSPSRLMMPLAFAGLISGMLSLVATPPNVVVHSELLRTEHGANVVGIERQHKFSTRVISPDSSTLVHEGDVLLLDLFSPKDDLRNLCQTMRLEPLHFKAAYFIDQSREVGMAEVALPPGSQLIGKNLLELTFRSRWGLNVVGLRRDQAAIDEQLVEEKLKLGDTLLVIGTWKAIRQLQTQPRDFLVLSLPAEVDNVAPALNQAPYALISLAVMVGLMISGLVPNVIAALIGCLLMGASRCIDMESAYRAIHWQSLILIVGMLPFALALQKTGGIALAVDGLVGVLGGAGPYVILATLFAITALIGLFISNTATAVLMAPVAITTAQQLGASPYPFAMIVALAASAAFMTPVSSPVNTLVLGPGQYRFADFVKVGVPFTILVMIVSVVMVPWIFAL
uniref:SLC13 family permease n=1 Tax=Steinernema glaseri TaxID=37863 RepID=A0A1I8AMW4_9BILA